MCRKWIRVCQRQKTGVSLYMYVSVCVVHNDDAATITFSMTIGMFGDVYSYIINTKKRDLFMREYSSLRGKILPMNDIIHTAFYSWKMKNFTPPMAVQCILRYEIY